MPKGFNRLADQILTRVRAVHLCRVEECDAVIVRRADDLDALLPRGEGPVVGADAHAPPAECRDHETAELSCLHIRGSCVGCLIVRGGLLLLSRWRAAHCHSCHDESRAREEFAAAERRLFAMVHIALRNLETH